MTLGVVGGIRVVECVLGTEEEVALVAGDEGGGAVTTDELDGMEAAVCGADGVEAVGEGDTRGRSGGNIDAAEHGVLNVVRRCQT